jgi:hypothetical protein
LLREPFAAMDLPQQVDGGEKRVLGAERAEGEGSVSSCASKVLLPEPLPFVGARFPEGGDDAMSGVQLKGNNRTIRSDGTGLSPLPLPGLSLRLQRAQRHDVQPPAVSH